MSNKALTLLYINDIILFAEENKTASNKSGQNLEN